MKYKASISISSSSGACGAYRVKRILSSFEPEARLDVSKEKSADTGGGVRLKFGRSLSLTEFSFSVTDLSLTASDV